MPQAPPGWYADPAGAPGRYRYWDGARWLEVTTGNPKQASPVGSSVVGSPSQSSASESISRSARSQRLALIMCMLAIVVSAVVATTVYVHNLRQVVAEPAPTPTATDLTGSSPTPTAEPSQTRSATPTPTTARPVRCPKGDPTLRASHPIDSWVYGGNLSFEEQPTFERAAVEPRFSFAYDVLQQTLPVSQNPPWIAQLAVGQLRGTDGFGGNDPRSTAENLVHCVLSGNMYSPYLPTRSDIRSESLNIDGHSGWLIDSEISVDRPDLQVAGDHTIFIVVRDGKNWGFFFGAVPIGNAQLDAVLARTIRGLRAT
jgi:Protein of unknown function (DUF2510)